MCESILLLASLCTFNSEPLHCVGCVLQCENFWLFAQLCAADLNRMRFAAHSLCFGCAAVRKREAPLDFCRFPLWSSHAARFRFSACRCCCCCFSAALFELPVDTGCTRLSAVRSVRCCAASLVVRSSCCCYVPFRGLRAVHIVRLLSVGNLTPLRFLSSSFVSLSPSAVASLCYYPTLYE